MTMHDNMQSPSSLHVYLSSPVTTAEHAKYICQLPVTVPRSLFTQSHGADGHYGMENFTENLRIVGHQFQCNLPSLSTHSFAPRSLLYVFLNLSGSVKLALSLLRHELSAAATGIWRLID